MKVSLWQWQKLSAVLLAVTFKTEAVQSIAKR